MVEVIRAIDEARALAERIRQERNIQGLSQAQLAKQAGITREALSRIETGRTRRPHPLTLWLLAAALRVPPAELTGAAPAGESDESSESGAAS